MLKDYTCTLIALMLAAALALGSAYMIQNVLDMLPCRLCKTQRVIYFLLLLECVIALWGKQYFKFHLPVIGVTLLLSASVALYHVGVEYDWWDSSLACSVPSMTISTGDAYSDKPEQHDMGQCHKPKARIFGVPLPAWNFLYSLCLLLMFSVSCWMIFKAPHSST